MADDGIDLTLPSTPPDIPQACLDRDPVFTYVALYTLVDLSDAELLSLQHVCEDEYKRDYSSEMKPGKMVRVAPQPRFIGESLRAVLNSHAEQCQQGECNPRYFVAVVNKDWGAKGVLLVALEDDFGNKKMDCLRTKADDIGLIVANLSVFNMAFEEYKDFKGISLSSDKEKAEDHMAGENSDS